GRRSARVLRSTRPTRAPAAALARGARGRRPGAHALRAALSGAGRWPARGRAVLMHGLLVPMGSALALGAGAFAFVQGFRALRLLWSIGPMRFRERALEEGRAVYVLGRAEPRPHAVEVSMDEEVLEATGTDAIGARYVRMNDGRCTAVIRKGPRDPALLISDK